MKRNKCSATKTPIGDWVFVGTEWINIDELQNIPYRWVMKDTEYEYFQIYFNGKWQVAQSIDFSFN